MCASKGGLNDVFQRSIKPPAMQGTKIDVTGVCYKILPNNVDKHFVSNLAVSVM